VGCLGCVDGTVTDVLTRDAATGEPTLRLCQRENTATPAVISAASPARIPGTVVQNAKKPPRSGAFCDGGGACSLTSPQLPGAKRNALAEWAGGRAREGGPLRARRGYDDQQDHRRCSTPRRRYGEVDSWDFSDTCRAGNRVPSTRSGGPEALVD